MTSTIAAPASASAAHDDRAEIVAMRGITKTYSNGVIEVEALRGIDLTIRDGEYVAIIGPSGSGKSTLMNIIGCLDVATDGEYLLDGQDVASLRENQLADIRNRRIGFVFQQYNLLASLNAWRNVELPLVYAGVSGGRRKQRALAALDLVGLGDRAEHRPGELSGGQQQRAAAARALVTDPALILADEPTGNLDSTSTGDMLDLLAALHAQGRTIVLITHDAEVASSAQRIVHVRDGVIVSDETNRHVRAAHATETTRAEPLLAGTHGAVLSASVSRPAAGTPAVTVVAPPDRAPADMEVWSLPAPGTAPVGPVAAEPVAEVDLVPVSPAAAPEVAPAPEPVGRVAASSELSSVEEVTEPMPPWFAVADLPAMLPEKPMTARPEDFVTDQPGPVSAGVTDAGLEASSGTLDDLLVAVADPAAVPLVTVMPAVPPEEPVTARPDTAAAAARVTEAEEVPATAPAASLAFPDVPWWRRRSAERVDGDVGLAETPDTLEDLMPTVVNLAVVPPVVTPPVVPDAPVVTPPVAPDAPVVTPVVAPVRTPAVVTPAPARPVTKSSWADGLPPARFVSGPDWPHPSRAKTQGV